MNYALVPMVSAAMKYADGILFIIYGDKVDGSTGAGASAGASPSTAAGVSLASAAGLG